VENSRVPIIITISSVKSYRNKNDDKIYPNIIDIVNKIVSKENDPKPIYNEILHINQIKLLDLDYAI
jgi:hypothetical protein